MASSSRSALVAALCCVASALPAQTGGRLVLAGRLLRVSGTDSIPLAGVFVIGHQLGRERQGALDSVRSDAAGRFRIVVARPDTAALYVVSSRYQGIGYFSQTVSPGDRPSAGSISLAVYDTSSTGPPLVLAMRHLVVGAPEGDTRRVLDIFQVGNAGTTARVAPDTVSPTWRVRLPTGIADFRPGEGDVSPASLRLDGDVLSVAAPFPPGDKQVVVSYALPPGARTIRVPFDDSVARVDLLLEDEAAAVSGAGFRPAEPLVLEGRSYTHFTASGVRAGAEATVRLGAAGAAGRRFAWIAVLGAAVALAASALVAARRRPPSGAEGPAGARPADAPEALAARIAALDERYEGREAEVPAEEWAGYAEQRAALKRRLEAGLAPPRSS